MIEYPEFASSVSVFLGKYSPKLLDRWKGKDCKKCLSARVLNCDAVISETALWHSSDLSALKDFLASWREKPCLVIGLFVEEDRVSTLVGLGSMHLESTRLSGVPLLAEHPEFPEISSIFVASESRGQGFGSAFVHYLSVVALAATEHTVPPLVRVSKNDKRMLSAMNNLAFSRLSGLTDEHLEYWWFVFGDYEKHRSFSSCLTDIRRNRGETQASLAFRCGVRRSAIAALETEQRLPSLNLLRFLVATVADTQEERELLISSALGGNDVTHVNMPHWRLLKDESCVWYVTDDLAWTDEEDAFHNILWSVEKGYQRVFFLSKAAWVQHGEFLQRQLDKKVGAADHLRFYTVPSALASLRVVIVGGDRRTSVGASIADQNQLGSLPASTCSHLTSALRRAMNEVADAPDGSFEGFSIPRPR